MWKPEEAAGFLNVLESYQGAFALMFFAGIRPGEVLRLDPKDVGDEILIRKEVSKNGRARVVTVTPNLRDWLNVYPFEGTGKHPFRKAREAACAASGMAWVPDVPRHCFATYAAALWGMDRTAEELGHTSTVMLIRHYRGLVRNRREAARAYFRIRP